MSHTVAIHIDGDKVIIKNNQGEFVRLGCYTAEDALALAVSLHTVINEYSRGIVTIINNREGS